MPMSPDVLAEDSMRGASRGASGSGCGPADPIALAASRCVVGPRCAWPNLPGSLSGVGVGVGFGLWLWLWLWLLRAGARALPRGPWGAAGGGRSARRVGRMDAAKVFDRPGRACPKTPTDSREPSAHGCAEGADEGWPFFWFLFLTPGILPPAPSGPPSAFAPLLRRSGHAKKRDSGRPHAGMAMDGHALGARKDGPKALALRFERRSDERRPRRVWSSWWVETHPMTAARSGRPQDGPKDLALRSKQRERRTRPRRALSLWWVKTHPMGRALTAANWRRDRRRRPWRASPRTARDRSRCGSG